MFLLIVWTVCTLFLSNWFKDDLVSCITMPDTPSTPTTVAGLFKSNMTLITTTYHLFNRERFSTLKDVILTDLVLSNVSGSGNYHETYRNKVLFLPEEIHLSVKNISQENTVRTGEHGMVKLPTSFASLDALSDSMSFRILMRNWTKYYIENKNVRDNPFTLFVPWFATRNYFTAEIFSRGVAALWESGIQEKWVSNSIKHIVLNGLLGTRRGRRNETVGRLYGMIVSGQFDRREMSENQFFPLGLNNLRIVFTLGVLLCVVATLIFLREILNFYRCTTRVEEVKVISRGLHNP